MEIGSGLELATPIQKLKGVGPRRLKDFDSAGIKTVEDLLLCLPRRYEDRENVLPITSLVPNNLAAIRGEIIDRSVRQSKRSGFSILDMVVRDGSGQIHVVFLNQPFLRSIMIPSQTVFVYGMVQEQPTTGVQFTNPDYEILSDTARGDENVHSGRIVPVYEQIGTLRRKFRRRLVYGVLKQLLGSVPDDLPMEVRKGYGFPSRMLALRDSHFPPSGTSLALLNGFRTPAQKRLIFEEYFFFQLGLARYRLCSSTSFKSHQIEVDCRVKEAAFSVVPFSLTSAQRIALEQIIDDLQRSSPMNRLLQGEVGSGKTIVALLAAVVVMENGFQVALLSPTEILAEQHYRTASEVLKDSRFEIGLVTGSMNTRIRRETISRLEAGKTQMVIGTHALLSENVKFRHLSMVVIDEQHRFGVQQRFRIRSKGITPDVLVMTATPIPRTLAMTIYGDLDISEIRDLPPGRQKVSTSVISDGRRDEVYARVDKELKNGRQAFVVCPFAEDSILDDLQSTREIAAYLSRTSFSERSVAVVHGQMSTSKRNSIMKSFRAREIDVLVATTVIEVGLDVPSASIMVVEHSQRFGLAQLHQLRGRVGRSDEQSHCILLFHEPLTESACMRLEILGATSDGFEVAQRDLEIRGPGDVGGDRQSGMPYFRVGDLVRDHAIMEDARRSVLSGSDELTIWKGVESGRLVEWQERYGLSRLG